MAEGKRVSWVELYLDLIVVLAVGQLSHLIVAHPTMRSVWIALGLFATIWWTWIGFAVLYNRHGVDEPAPRLWFLAASIPMGVAAVAIEPTSVGDAGMFAASMAVARLILAGAHAADGGWTNALRRRITQAYLASAAVFAVSIVVPEPWRYVLWGVAVRRWAPITSPSASACSSSSCSARWSSKPARHRSTVTSPPRPAGAC